MIITDSLYQLDKGGVKRKDRKMTSIIVVHIELCCRWRNFSNNSL